MTPTLMLVLIVPVLSGALLWHITRKDRRRQFVQQRLFALIATKDEGTPQLRRLLQQITSVVVLPAHLQRWLDAAFEATGNTIRLLHLPVAGLIAGLVVFGFSARVLALNPALVILLSLVAAIAAPFLLIRIGQARYQRRFLDVFPDALDLVGRGVKAGLPVNESLHAAGHEIADPVGRELRRAFEQVQLGVPMIDALQQIANRVRVADFRFMVVALALQAKTGGSLAETLGNLSKVIRARKSLRLKARSLSAEAKVSAGILAALPFVVGGFMYAINRDLMRVLFVDPRGYFMLGIAFLSLTTGMTTMYVLVKRALR